MGDVGGIAQAGASVAAAGIQAGTATYAANKQYDAASNALNFQKGMYNAQQANAAPYLDAGNKGVWSLLHEQNFQAPTAAEAAQQPGYQFQLQQGQNAMQNKLVAGGQAGGNAFKSMEDYTQGLASSNYNNVYNQALQTYNTNSNRYSTLAGIGLNANNQTASASQNYANSASNIAEQQGNASAAGAIGVGNALSSLPLTMSYLGSQGQGGNQVTNYGYGGSSGATGQNGEDNFV